MSNHTWMVVGIALTLMLSACASETEPAATPDTEAATVTTSPAEASTATTATVESDVAGTVGVSPEPPTEFDLGFDSIASSLDRQVRRGQGVELAHGQTFSFAEDTTLDSITVKLEATEGPLDDVIVALEMYRFSGVDDFEPNELLSEDGFENPQLFTLPSGLDGAAYVTFDIADLTVLAGEQYGFLVRFADGAPSGEAWIHHLEDDAYPDGMPFSFEGATWKGATITSDLVFFLATA